MYSKNTHVRKRKRTATTATTTTTRLIPQNTRTMVPPEACQSLYNFLEHITTFCRCHGNATITWDSMDKAKKYFVKLLVHKKEHISHSHIVLIELMHIFILFFQRLPSLWPRRCSSLISYGLVRSSFAWSRQIKWKWGVQSSKFKLWQATVIPWFHNSLCSVCYSPKETRSHAIIITAENKTVSRQDESYSIARGGCLNIILCVLNKYVSVSG